MRSVFFGTPSIAVPALRALSQISNVLAVVCQPDRPAGRGLVVTEPAVKRAARELGVPVLQPVKVKTGDLHERLRELRADVAVVMAYGRILPSAVLSAPRAGCLNLHASLLPKYRGAAPINWAIVHGETTTGISLMQMDEGLDTGPVYTRHALAIAPDETAGILAARLSELAASVVLTDVPRVLAGELRAEPQDPRAASHAPPITREHTQIDWNRPAADIANLVRGMAPKPGAHTRARGKLLRVLSARPANEDSALPAGTVLVRNRNQVFVQAKNSSVELLDVQLEGKKPTRSSDLLNGRQLSDGEQLG